MPDNLIRDIPTIQRHARRNEDEDWRFRTFLKVKLDLPNDALDGVVREITDDVWRHIDCTTCAHCCRTLQIVVDSKDITRLAGRMGMKTRAFAQQYVAVDADTTQYLKASPCPFLGSDNRCTVYEDRPQACRDYPYLYEKHFRSRSLSMIENAASCPIVFNVWQTLKQRFPLRRSR